VNPQLEENHRYCRPWTARFLADWRGRTKRRSRSIEVSSAVRTVEYQKRLMRTKWNAAPAEGDMVSRIDRRHNRYCQEGLSRRRWPGCGNSWRVSKLRERSMWKRSSSRRVSHYRVQDLCAARNADPVTTPKPVADRPGGSRPSRLRRRARSCAFCGGHQSKFARDFEKGLPLRLNKLWKQAAKAKIILSG